MTSLTVRFNETVEYYEIPIIRKTLEEEFIDAVETQGVFETVFMDVTVNEEAMFRIFPKLRERTVREIISNLYLDNDLKRLKELKERCNVHLVMEDFLMKAAQIGDLDMVKYALNFTSETDYVKEATMNGRLNVVKYAIEERGEDPRDLEYFATISRDVDTVKYVLSKGCKADIYSITDALENNDKEIVLLLIESGYDTTDKLSVGLFENSDFSIFKEIFPKYLTPTICTLESCIKDIEKVKYIVSHGVRPTEYCMCLAASENCYDVVFYLRRINVPFGNAVVDAVDYTASASLRFILDEMGENQPIYQTALEKAINLESITCINLLINYGAIVTQKMVETSVFIGNRELFLLLRKFCSEYKYSDDIFIMALHGDSADMVEIFIKEGRKIPKDILQKLQKRDQQFSVEIILYLREICVIL